jgi:serine protease inhibitor
MVLSSHTVDFIAVHPFVFLVVEKSGADVFMGQVLDPTARSE